MPKPDNELTFCPDHYDSSIIEFCKDKVPGTLITKCPSGKILNVSPTSRYYKSFSNIEEWPFEHIVEKTGYYCARIVNPSRTVLRMQFQFINPFGLLRPELYPLMLLSKLMMITWIICLGFWIAMSVKYKKDLLPVQNHIALLLALNAIESFVQWNFYNHTNIKGHPELKWLCIVLIVGAVRTTCSLFCVLLLAMGYGVVVY